MTRSFAAAALALRLAVALQLVGALCAPGTRLTRRAVCSLLPLGLASSRVAAADRCVCRDVLSCRCLSEESLPPLEKTSQKVMRLDANANGKVWSIYDEGLAVGSKTRAAPPPAEKPRSARPNQQQPPPSEVPGVTLMEKYDTTEFITSAEEARYRFADMLAQTVAKQEAQTGFTLDASDVRELEAILRVKYCGPEGLIGPC